MSILNSAEKYKITFMIKMNDEDAGRVLGGKAAPMACAASIAFNASLGGLFGGAGALVGAAFAATGPACLGWW